METSYLLHLMMSTKNYIFVVLAGVILCVVGCTNEQALTTANCGINGSISVSGAKITIVSVLDASVQHVAVSDANRNFYFRGLEAGSYIIKAEKDGYEMGHIILEGNTILGKNQQKIIELKEHEIKEITISMSPIDVSSIGRLAFTDMSGNQLNNILIPQNATTISLRLFNGTQGRCHWKIRYDGCFGSIGFDVEYLFSSFNVSEGYLEAGDNVVLVGYINPNIFTPEFSLLSSYFYLYDGSIVSREYSVSIVK